MSLWILWIKHCKEIFLQCGPPPRLSFLGCNYLGSEHGVLTCTFFCSIVSRKYLIMDFLPSRHHLSKQPSNPVHSKWGKWDFGPRGGPVSGWSARQQGGPGVPHWALDRYAQLRLCGLCAGSVHRWTQQGHPADSTIPEHDWHQVVMQQGDGETVWQQSLQE